MNDKNEVWMYVEVGDDLFAAVGFSLLLRYTTHSPNYFSLPSFPLVLCDE